MISDFDNPHHILKWSIPADLRLILPAEQVFHLSVEALRGALQLVQRASAHLKDEVQPGARRVRYIYNAHTHITLNNTKYEANLVIILHVLIEK